MRMENQARPEGFGGRSVVGRRFGLRVAIVSLLFILLVAPAASSAQHSPARKLGRGLANVSLGFMAIPSTIIHTTRDNGPAVGATWGLIKGTGLMVATEFVGLFEFLTAPFETPPDYAPILDPEFPWQRFAREPESQP